ncbi:heparan-alpha-glucosaminide N-acetyltransferase [Arctopsyche grandis]|uniref:heparan-alpha-glucosaminide N-acetyltransferase n=1 Tax=Arctopsyche grandis TaxID=121162 RepID=UPI00406D8B36
MSWIEDPGSFDEFNLTSLKVDQAYLITNSDRNDAWVYSLSDDCYSCPYTRLFEMGKTSAVWVKHNAKYRVYPSDTNLTVLENETKNQLCDINHSMVMDEFGVYNLTLEKGQCNFNTLKEPVNIYLPILIVFFILLGIAILTQAYTLIKNKYSKPAGGSFQERAPAKRRVRALDTFRGMSIVLMIFVNDGGGKYWWIEHATWNGLTFGDLVFPFFLWIMGVCIPISAKSLVSKNVPKYKSLLNIFQRSCKLFLIGLALGTIWPTTLQNMRIFGVLQRFGISYFIVGSLVVLMSRKWKEESKNKFIAMFQDIIVLGWHWLIMLALVTVHLVITFCLPVPGCETGYLGPGGKHENWAHTNCIGGATKYIDLVVLGDQHLYQNPTAKSVYNSGSFDPEGVFGCILSVVHVFFGVQAGTTLLYHHEWKKLITRWLCWGVVTGVVGGALCNFSQEGGVIPVNKNMWSLSYLLVTSSFAFILLSICYILIDVAKIWNGSPFIQPGMNAIIMYIGHSICWSIFPFHWSIPDMETHFINLIESTWGTILWILVAFVLVKKKIFFTI